MQFTADDERAVAFSRHGAPLQPLGDENTIRSAAANVVQSVPLPDEPREVADAKVASSIYGDGGVQQSDIGVLEAEDIREEDFM